MTLYKHLYRVSRYKIYGRIKMISKKIKIFLSHSRKDKEFVEKVAGRLTNDEYSVWYDDWEIKIGDSIVQKINDGISRSDFLIVILSKNSVNSKWVAEEMNAATIKNIEAKGAFILPVLLEKCKIPALLSDKKYADFTKGFEKAYGGLIDAMRHNIDLVVEPDEEIIEGEATGQRNNQAVNDTFIEENWLNLLEDDNEICTKRYLMRIREDLKSCFFEIIELEGNKAPDSKILKYHQTIDTISILILTLLKYDIKHYQEELIDLLKYGYHLIAGADPRFTGDNPRGKQAELWLSIITRVYLLGAIAIKMNRFAIIKPLILVEPSWSDYWRTYYWARHCLIMYARSTKNATSKEGLVALSNQTIQEVAWCEHYFEMGSREALSNLGSFDLYLNILAAHHSSLDACYPSFAQFRNNYLWQTLQDIGLKRNSYSIIEDIPESEVAQILLNLDDYAGKVFSYATGWRKRSFPEELNEFIKRNQTKDSTSAS